MLAIITNCHCKQFDREEHEPITERDFTEVVKAMLGGRTNVRFENREPTKKQLETRFKLEH
ncbi:MAG: hypothetical protein OXD01_05625 [Gammaproteobacteria bacterium]|nr:hypothetical protein [Gammaproteobacteria bacterium]